jgi:hypothetical protein
MIYKAEPFAAAIGNNALISSQSKSIDPDPLCWLTFTEDSIITSCKTGKKSSLLHVKMSLEGNVIFSCDCGYWYRNTALFL